MSDKKRSIAREYPWKRWFSNKSGFTLFKGKHFHCQTHGMVHQIRNKSSKMGIPVSVRVKESSQGDKIVVKFRKD